MSAGTDKAGLDAWHRSVHMLVGSGIFAKDLSLPDGQDPDEFVLNQVMLEKVAALAAIKRMRERWARPRYDALSLVALLEIRGLPQTAAHLRDVVALI